MKKVFRYYRPKTRMHELTTLILNYKDEREVTHKIKAYVNPLKIWVKVKQL